MNTRLLLVAALAAFGLAACGERPQSLDHVNGEKKLDFPAWSKDGSARPEYVAPGWERGDQAGWEKQLQRRTQLQNEYER